MATLSLLRFSPLPPLQTLPKPYFSSPSPIVQTPLRFKPTVGIPSLLRKTKTKPISTSYRTTVPATDRLISVLSYSLPFLNALHYGRFLFARFPALGLVFGPLLPIINVYRSIPLAGFVAFFALYLGVVRNPVFSRYVRFNSMQSVVLDVLLAIPSLLQRVFGVPARGLGFQILEIGYDVVFVFSAACFFYSLVSCVLGRTPHLPLVASAADRQL